MDLDFIPPLIVFAVVSAGTPGPNNVMLLASGANFGIRRTIPHIAGINIGFALMAILAGLGLAQVFATHPAARTALTVVSVAYLLYLAFRIATAKPPKRIDGPEESKSDSRPMTFLQAAMFQWVNPKAWAGALGVITIYAPGNSVPEILLTVLVACLAGLPCNTAWVVMGRQLRHVLNDPRRLRIFNVTMALLLVASLYPMFF